MRVFVIFRFFVCVLFSFFFFCHAKAQINLANGLVGHYPFNGDVNDASGNNINGTGSNVALTTDRNGTANSAYYFNGTNASILLPYSNLYNFSPTGQHSISVWVQPDINPSWPAQSIVVKSPPNPNYLQSLWNYGIYSVGQKAMAGYADNHVVTGTTTMNANQCWYNITYTYDNGIWHLYVNGVEESADLTQTKFILQEGSASRIAFGKKGQSSGDYYKGKMDDVRIYSRVLNQQEIAVLSQQPAACQSNCTNWLNLPNLGSKVTIGDLDVSGNQLTIEATFNRTQPLNSGIYYGHLVSKHTDQTNANYALLPNGCEITTTNGYKATFQTCVLDVGKTYHVAMVYDGVSLKYYRNGLLRSEVPCTGNIVTNNLLTTIGQVAGGGNPVDNQFLGVINEVRIWNVARTQNQLLTAMGAALPNPSTQTGLLGYYSFDNLLNKQGNTAWNGTLIGSASLNQTNPSCPLASDLCSVIGPPVVAVFNTPETVCVNEPVNISNTSQNATSYYWNFCQANITQPPTGTNLGNLGGVLSVPVFMDYVFVNNNYYGFSVNFFPGRLIRLNFGNSLLNTPTTTDLGNFGGVIPDYAEGIQMIQNEGRWYAIMVGGSASHGVEPRVLKIDFGADITSLTAVATNWGNLGNMAQPLDLHVFQDNNNWYGFTVNGDNSTITRFNFTNSFNNTPTAVNLGNIGNIAYPDGIYAIKDNNEWKVFITNGGNDSRTNGAWSLTRLDFGTSLLNTPTGVNLGNPGNILKHPRDLTIMKFCEETIGFAVNGAIGSNDIVKIDFHNDLNSIPTLTSLGNTGNLNFPVSITKLFREGPDLYSFVSNAGNNTITRLKFAGCTNSSIPNSTLQNPPPVSYNTPGVYNINLTVDDGLPTQTTFCKQVVVEDCSDSVIINKYTEVLNLADACKNIIEVANASEFFVGDTVLMIQMKGAVIDSSNTASFGSITDYKNAGNYEFNYIKSKNGNRLELLNVLERQYDFANGKVQLIKVPYFQDYNVTTTLTCLPWDGSKGGVLVFNVQNNLTLNKDIDVSGKGFKGGIDPFSNPAAVNCYQNQFYYPPNPDNASGKGEGIAIISSQKSFGKGDLANGGGGGNSHNSGGGGGSNGNAGGTGGYNYELTPCNTTVPFDNRGIGGRTLNYNNTVNKIFLGGGGGAGQSNNPEGFQALGGNGAGIVIISANNIVGNNYVIKAKGADGLPCAGLSGFGCHEGMGGGGAGGTVLLNINSYSGILNCNTSGGKGGDMIVAGAGRLGPGGGGGGGVTWFTSGSLPANINITNSGGTNGVNTAYSNDAWGAAPGQAGQNIFGLQLPIDDVPFKPNIDSVKAILIPTSCKGFDFNGLAYTNTYPVASWQWHFGDNTTNNNQNTNHTYTNPGNYTVKLVVTDINGCKDSIVLNISADCPPETIINDYTEAISFDICKNILTVADATEFNIGDTVLLIQMKGAIIDSTNTANFGNITNLRNAGNYEFNYIKSKNGNSIELLNALGRQYDFADGKVQLVRVPYFQNYNVLTKLTCLPWNGSKGGVLVFNVQNNLTLNADIDVSNRGFKGGAAVRNAVYHCNIDSFYLKKNDGINGNMKGEGIYFTPNLLSGRGKLVNGGGGGNSVNSGGAGGGNAGKGGEGGKQYVGTVCNNNFTNGGVGGSKLTYSNASNKIYLGGGGGAGHEDDSPLGPGGNGGGIIIISANTITTSSYGIKADGETPQHINGTNDDGRSGAGAGGTILLNYSTLSGNINVSAKGGKGDYCIAPPAQNLHGPGGGGGGGIVWVNKPTIESNLTVNINGGASGTNINQANNPWGATAGENGVTLTELVLPIGSIPFKKNIDSVRINKSSVSCSSFDFHGLGYTNTYPVASWHWNFGDNSTANTQNTNHSYTAAGTYTVKLVVTDINGCKDSITTDVTATSLLEHDFIVETDVCDPYTVQIIGTGPGIGGSNTCGIDPGDGSPLVTGVCNTAHTYTMPGNYTIKYILSNGICSDTVTKTVSIGVTNDNIIITPDTTICPGTTKQLRTNTSLDFCWSPVTYLDNPNSPQPFTSTPENITYYFTAQVTGNNLIVNGNFSQGNTGFISDYVSSSINTTEGQYLVNTNPVAWNGGMSPCGDHTSGTGNMMMVNGSPVANANVWKQTVAVTPNTNYAFSTWIQALLNTNLAQVQFSINGITVGTVITPSLPTCSWTQFFTTWNSGNSASAVISIVNKNTLLAGNDFALDDISFAPVFVKRDSVIITVDNPFVKTNEDTLICAGEPVQLQTSGAQTYSWTPATNLSNTGIANPIASPVIPTDYIVTGTNANGCIAKDTVKVNIHTKPTINLSNDTTICNNTSAQLFVNGGVSYNWWPPDGLNNTTTPNPVASPTDTTKYYVTITDNNNCDYLDSVTVSVKPPAVFSISAPDDLCLNDSLQLNASGGNIYSWQPSTSLSNSNIANPKASPGITTDYTVSITETTCNESTQLSTRITVLMLPNIQASRSNDIDCSNDQSQLNAIGGNSYSWTPSSSLNNSTIVNPIAKPTVTTQYIVKGTDLSGCENYDTIMVNVTDVNRGGYLMPNAFTPNGDGLNDCYGIRFWGVIEEVEFSIYNRWGERIFHTTNPTQCWDGTYRGVKQNPDVFVYMIKAKTSCEPSVFRKGTFVLIR